MQKTDNKTPTVFDVAKEAGVSRGTVDRVLHGRGRVSQQTRDKVQKAIASLGYTPNSAASLLASKKEYRFSCLIPDFAPGEYWEEMNSGFLAAAREYSSGAVSVTIHHYNQQDVESFKAEKDKILEERPSGVIMNAVFREEVTAFARELEAARIPYAFIDNKIDELDYTLYYGVDPYKSGVLGAYLLTNRTVPEEVAMVRILRDPSRRADPNRPRRHGFSDYIEDHFPQCRIHSVFIDPGNPGGIAEELEAFFAAHPGVHHIAITNSRVFLLGEYLREHPDPQRIVVGFDDLKKNLECLGEGLIDCLVTRHIPMQAYNAFTAFADCLTRGVRPAHRNHFVHMGILTLMNIDNY